MLSRLKVRTKLLTILLPLLLAIGVLATLGVISRLDQRSDAQRTVQLVGTARFSAALVHDLQTERLLYSALQNGYAPAGPLVDKAKPVTDGDAARLRTQLDVLRGANGTIGGSTPTQVATTISQQLDSIAGARAVYDPNSGSAASVIDAYTSIIQSLLGANADLLSSSTGVGGTGESVHWLSTAKDADARSVADVSTIIADTADNRLPDANPAISDVTGLQDDASNATKVFSTDATQYGRHLLDDVLRDSRYNASVGLWSGLGTIDQAVGLDTPMSTWLSVAQGRLDAIRVAESGVLTRELHSATSRSDNLEKQVRLYLGGSVTALLLALLLATSVTRSITNSLGRLTRAARTISTEQLPKLVESLKHPDAEHNFQVTDIDLNSQDEFAELATAFNAVEQTALDVAAEQVQTLRKGISDLFVNLARRNQSLLDRQIEFIDRLEANEEDPDQLENLFKLDHLATRMRRNAESLLVLAGAEAPRRRTKEVSLTDVIRVAVGEVEDFSRITLLAVDEANAIGSAAVDVAHLLSELMENGTQYSPPERRVEVVGHRTNDGGYVISLSDQGIGMEPEAMAEANRLLARPPAVGLSLSRSLGFVVIATLAHRHGITVRLTVAPSGGVAALVTLPPPLLVHAEAPSIPVRPETPKSQIVADSGLAAAVAGPVGDPGAALPDMDLGQLIQPSQPPFLHHRIDGDGDGPDGLPEVVDGERAVAPPGDMDVAPPFQLDEDPFAEFDEPAQLDAPLGVTRLYEEPEPAQPSWDPPAPALPEPVIEPAHEPMFEAVDDQAPETDWTPVQAPEPDWTPVLEPAPEPQPVAEPEPQPVAEWSSEPTPEPTPEPTEWSPQPSRPMEHAESMQQAASMADALPMGVAFEQGLFALLDHPDGRTDRPTPPSVPSEAAPQATPTAGPRVDPVPLAAEMHPLLPEAGPAAESVGHTTNGSTNGTSNGSTNGISNGTSNGAIDEPVIPVVPTPMATPLPTPVPLVAPGLPQRRPTTPLAQGAVENVERIGSPSRPPEEIRSILSRYRSGLESGRSEGGEATDPSSDPIFPDYE